MGFAMHLVFEVLGYLIQLTQSDINETPQMVLPCAESRYVTKDHQNRFTVSLDMTFLPKIQYGGHRHVAFHQK